MVFSLNEERIVTSVKDVVSVGLSVESERTSGKAEEHRSREWMAISSPYYSHNGITVFHRILESSQ